MSQENVNKVREGIEAFNRRDFDAALVLLSDDITWERYLSRAESATSEVRGKEELRAVWQSQVDAVDLRGEPHEFISVGDSQVIVVMDLVARGSGSDIPLRTSVAWTYTFDAAGTVNRVETFETRDEALRAAR